MKQKKTKSKLQQEPQRKSKSKRAKSNMTDHFLQDVDPNAAREATRYEHPIASREYILQFISDCKKSPTFKELVERLKISSQEQKKALDKRLVAMIRDGQLRLVNHRYQVVLDCDLLEGTIISHPDGFGFLKIGNNQDDLYIPNYEMRKVLPGDVVKAMPVPSARASKKIEAKIIRIVTRKIKQLVARVVEQHGVLFLEPDDKNINTSIKVDSDTTLAIKVNQMVLAEVTSYPTKEEEFKARVIEIIGDYHAPGVEIQTALRKFQIPHEWPEKVLQEVESFSTELSEADKKGRLDLRNTPLVTIDGEDAKDFDDAVFCEQLDNGGFRLIVAIADVSNYVTPDSPLDQEAYLRGTSVYFPGKVVPMLPEVLSNGLCSLNPNVDRLCFACEAILDCDGKIEKYRFLPALMRSHARLTYTKVAAIIIDNDQELSKQYSNLVPHLHALYQLFTVLNQERNERGAIDFDSTETMIEFDDNLKIEAIHPVVRNNAHRLIEECMLVANVAAAHFCLRNKIPVLYRNHEPPPEDKLQNLQEFLKPLGLGLKRLPPSPKDISKLLTRVHSRPDNHVIQMVVLRSLCQALYEPQNKGHFGLAYEQYAHFTSPIRRYPDLLLHRQLHYHLAESQRWHKFAASSFKKLDHNAKHYFNNTRSNLEQMGQHCSTTERRADEATRDVTAWLKCEYMQDKVGMVFTGCVSSVTSFGVFIELDEVYVEGLLHITDLGDDYYQYDERQHLLRGERAGKTYRIGDQIEIKVARVDLESRFIDFILADADISSSAGRGAKSRPKSNKSNKSNKFSRGKDKKAFSNNTTSESNSKSKDKNKAKSRKKNKVKTRSRNKAGKNNKSRRR